MVRAGGRHISVGQHRVPHTGRIPLISVYQRVSPTPLQDNASHDAHSCDIDVCHSLNYPINHSRSPTRPFTCLFHNTTHSPISHQPSFHSLPPLPRLRVTCFVSRSHSLLPAMGAGISNPSGTVTVTANGSTTAPNHHVTIGGLTGITHGSLRHVTWSLYHETGYHSVHLQHDGLSGRRLVQCDGKDIFFKKAVYALFDSSSSHTFDLATLQLIPPSAASAAASTTNPAATHITVNVEEKDTYFLYTTQINHLHYRDYQLQFWNRSTIYTLPILTMGTSRRNADGSRRLNEEGISESAHSIVIIHTPQMVVLVDGKPCSEVIGGFGSGEDLSYTFPVETTLSATYTLTPHTAQSAAGSSSTKQHSDGVLVEGGGSRYYVGKLVVGSEEVPAMARPPLLPASWKAQEQKSEKRKEELAARQQQKPVEEQKEQNDVATERVTITM